MNVVWITASLLGVAWGGISQDATVDGKSPTVQERATPRGVELRVLVTSKDARPFDLKDFSATLLIDRLTGSREEIALTYVPSDVTAAVKPEGNPGVMPDRRAGQIREIEGTSYYAELVLASMKARPEPDAKPRQDDGRDRRQDPPAAGGAGYFRAELPGDDVDTLKFSGEIVFKIKNEVHTARGYRWPFPGLIPLGAIYPKFDEDLGLLERQMKAYDLASMPATVDKMLESMPAGAAEKHGEVVGLLKEVRSAASDKKRDLARDAFTRLKSCCQGSKDSQGKAAPEGASPTPSAGAAPGGSK
jgi:hypothetical protein